MKKKAKKAQKRLQKAGNKDTEVGDRGNTLCINYHQSFV